MSDFWRIVLSALVLFVVFFIGWFVAVLRDGRRLRGMRGPSRSPTAERMPYKTVERPTDYRAVNFYKLRDKPDPSSPSWWF